MRDAVVVAKTFVCCISKVSRTSALMLRMRNNTIQGPSCEILEDQFPKSLFGRHAAPVPVSSHGSSGMPDMSTRASTE